MISKITSKCRVPKRITSIIKKLSPLTGGEWEFSKYKKDKFVKISKVSQDKIERAIQEFKVLVARQLKNAQKDKCAYCGSLLHVTSPAEIEHIAPKGGAKRPNHVEFTFLPLNLVLSCSLCNRSTKKGTKETVRVKNIDYSQCLFKIVHPYFDNPEDHYEWNGSIIIGKTDKGKSSIEMFKLDGEALTTDREKNIKSQAYDRILASGDKELIERVLSYTI